MKNDFLKYLQKEFATRQENNSSYSLRAFARDLGIEPSLLSKILREKISVTDRMFERLASVLPLTSEEFSIFEKQIAENMENRQIVNIEVKQIDSDKFVKLGDWYNLALPEMMALKDYKSDTRWMGEKIGLPLEKIEESIELLLDLGLIAFDDAGNLMADKRYERGIFRMVTENRELYKKVMLERTKQIMQKYIEYMDAPSEERNKAIQSYLTIAMDESLIEEIQEDVRKFISTLVSKIDKKSKSKGRVYELSLSLFPITK